MENASKALLIAAAVLIVILLIAFGMRIFSSTANVSGQATEVGNSLTTQTTNATTSATSALNALGGWQAETVTQ